MTILVFKPGSNFVHRKYMLTYWELMWCEIIINLQKVIKLRKSAASGLLHESASVSFQLLWRLTLLLCIATGVGVFCCWQSKSVLENHHWKSLLCLLRLSHVFDHFDSDTWYVCFVPFTIGMWRSRPKSASAGCGFHMKNPLDPDSHLSPDQN